MTTIVLCVVYRFQHSLLKSLRPFALSSVNFLSTKHVIEFYKNLLKRSHFGQNHAKVPDFTRRTECVAVRRWILQQEKEMLQIRTAEKNQIPGE
jgi:hypothetical protein